ncbi:MAG TPA: FHA domain-containing protein [Isosphaeraceae bacterium]|nr:FHA domain-containing protein [Isosphaeraceae bacterium]
MIPGDPRGQPGPARRQGTVLESVEEIRAQIRGAMFLQGSAEVPAGAAEPDQDTKPYRPTLRPSMALLTVLDDGEETGEVLRIRGNSFLIGRVDGNLTIPHDSGISGRHAEISRRFEHGEHRWYLRDLQSTNGTFVRAASVILSPDQEVLIGGCRLRFEVPAASSQPTPPGPEANVTRKWEALAGPQAVATWHPVLVDISPGRAGRRFPLTEPESWVGRDPRLCSIVLDDPMTDRKHARLYRDEKHRWVLANARSRNGLWARIEDVALGRGGAFQCGEQRFLFKVV